MFLFNVKIALFLIYYSLPVYFVVSGQCSKSVGFHLRSYIRKSVLLKEMKLENCILKYSILLCYALVIVPIYPSFNDFVKKI